MTLHEVVKCLNAEVHACPDKLDRVVDSACGADLMSDVLAFAKESCLLLSGLINPQTIRTAEMMDVKVVTFVRGKLPTAEMLHLARECKIVVLSTNYTMYTACGILYANGLGVLTDAASL